jgi:hypothetical protein
MGSISDVRLDKKRRWSSSTIATGSSKSTSKCSRNGSRQIRWIKFRRRAEGERRIRKGRRSGAHQIPAGPPLEGSELRRIAIDLNVAQENLVHRASQSIDDLGVFPEALEPSLAAALT